MIQYEVGQRVKIIKDLMNMIDYFKSGHEFTILWIGRDQVYFDLIDDNQKNLTSVTKPMFEKV